MIISVVLIHVMARRRKFFHKDRPLHYAVCCIISDWLSQELTDLTSYLWQLASLASRTSWATGASVWWPSPASVVSEVITVHRRLDVPVRMGSNSAYTHTLTP